MLLSNYKKMVGPAVQVDFQRPVVISKIATQGAKQFFTSHFVLNYTIFYSTDRKRWSWYKGDSKTSRKVNYCFSVYYNTYQKYLIFKCWFCPFSFPLPKTFEGNREAHEVKENIFFPPIISRYVRLYPSHSYNYPTVRMEFFGCELDGRCEMFLHHFYFKNIECTQLRYAIVKYWHLLVLVFHVVL